MKARTSNDVGACLGLAFPDNVFPRTQFFVSNLNSSFNFVLFKIIEPNPQQHCNTSLLSIPILPCRQNKVNHALICG